MPIRQIVTVTERKVQIAYLIKDAGAEANRTKISYGRRPITDREWEDAKFLAQFPNEMLQTFLLTKQILGLPVKIVNFQEKKPQNQKEVNMPDRFFTVTKCDRCGAELKARQMSRFNTDVLCLQCIEEEKQHPDYEKAAAAELAAVRRGDRDFPGIGWPGKDGRVK